MYVLFFTAASCLQKQETPSYSWFIGSVLVFLVVAFDHQNLVAQSFKKTPHTRGHSSFSAVPAVDVESILRGGGMWEGCERRGGGLSKDGNSDCAARNVQDLHPRILSCLLIATSFVICRQWLTGTVYVTLFFKCGKLWRIARSCCPTTSEGGITSWTRKSSREEMRSLFKRRSRFSNSLSWKTFKYVAVVCTHKK